MSSCLTLTLSSGGSEDWIGAKVSRTEPFATNGSTARTFAWNVGDRRTGQARRSDVVGPEPDDGATECHGEAQPAERPAEAAARIGKAGEGDRRSHAQESQPRRRTRKREPGGDSAPEADHEPNRKLGTLRLEQLLQLLVKCGKPRPPIAPSTLWKRRFPYVRGARPLHCSIKRRGKCA